MDTLENLEIVLFYWYSETSQDSSLAKVSILTVMLIGDSGSPPINFYVSFV